MRYYVLVLSREFEQYCGVYAAESDEELAADYIDKHFHITDLTEKEKCEADFYTFTIKPEVGKVLSVLEDWHPREVGWVGERASGGEEYCAGMNDSLVAFLIQFQETEFNFTEALEKESGRSKLVKRALDEGWKPSFEALWDNRIETLSDPDRAADIIGGAWEELHPTDQKKWKDLTNSNWVEGRAENYLTKTIGEKETLKLEREIYSDE